MIWTCDRAIKWKIPVVGILDDESIEFSWAVHTNVLLYSCINFDTLNVFCHIAFGTFHGTHTYKIVFVK